MDEGWGMEDGDGLMNVWGGHMGIDGWGMDRWMAGGWMDEGMMKFIFLALAVFSDASQTKSFQAPSES